MKTRKSSSAGPPPIASSSRASWARSGATASPDLAITSTQREGASPHTALVGPLRDQAELNGILETLYSLHLPILRVEQVEDEDMNNRRSDRSMRRSQEPQSERNNEMKAKSLSMLI